MLNAQALGLLAARQGVVHHWLMWVEARNRDTGAPETMGLWTGDDHQTFTVDGQIRGYFGAGGVLSIGELTAVSGTSVQMQQVTIGPAAPEVELLLRGYDTKGARVELHLAIFDPDTLQLVDIDRQFRGEIDKAPIRHASNGGGVTSDMTLASSARQGTRTLALKKSQQAQSLRDDDQFMRHAAVSGEVTVWWGEKRSGVPKPKKRDPDPPKGGGGDPDWKTGR